MPIFKHDGVAFHFREEGSGLPFLFQHGLGGEIGQPFGLYQPPRGIRMIAFDYRAHGKTSPLGDVDKISIRTFADDQYALIKHLRIDRAVIGGISMGAAVGLNFALRYPQCTIGLVLSRPAWLAEPNRDNAETFTLIAKLLRTYGPVEGKKHYLETEHYRTTRAESTDVANSLCGQFDNPDAVERAVRLGRIPWDRPCESLHACTTIRVPTLVMANRMDPVHPFHMGETLAEEIPGAEFMELTPKSVSVEQHGADYQEFLTVFFCSHWKDVLC